VAVVIQAFRFALDPTAGQDAALRSHCGAQRFAFNWGLALVTAVMEQRKAEASYGIPHIEWTPAVGWSAYSLRKLWNDVKERVAPWGRRTPRRRIRPGWRISRPRWAIGTPRRPVPVVDPRSGSRGSRANGPGGRAGSPPARSASRPTGGMSSPSCGATRNEPDGNSHQTRVMRAAGTATGRPDPYRPGQRRHRKATAA
jgi:hypothetical protein